MFVIFAAKEHNNSPIMAKFDNITRKGKSNLSKGERLGWPSVSDLKPRLLRDIVGNGEKVNVRDYSIPNKKRLTLIP